MPRATTERLFGYGAQVHKEKIQLPKQETTADGGEPTVTMEEHEITILAFVDASNGHRVEIPLGDVERQAIVQGLTGGITIASQMPGSQ